MRGILIEPMLNDMHH